MPIKSRQQENGIIRFYLVDLKYFDSIFDLVSYYQSHPLVSPRFSQTLGRAVPPPNRHEEMEWFRANCSRQQAEEMLLKVAINGAFVVRKGERVAGSFVISFR